MQLSDRDRQLLLPEVSPEMLRPEFWCKRFPDLELDADWIGTVGLPSEPTIESYINNINQLGNLYNEDGSPLALEKTIERSAWWNRPEYGLLTEAGDLKLLPREEPLFSCKGKSNFDRNQLSGLDPGDQVNLFGRSADGNWFGVISDTGIGWVKQNIVGTGTKNEVQAYQNEQPRLVLIDPDAIILWEGGTISASMGCSFPLNDHFRRTIVFPRRNHQRKSIYKTGIIIGETVRDHLPQTTHHLIRQAFKYLGYRYAWGDRDPKGFGRDCSRLVKDVLRSIGFRPPRNSREQLAAGKKRITLAGMNTTERLNRLKAVPPGSLLFTAGHVMFYLGEYRGEVYAIHALSGYKQISNNMEEPVKVNQVVVSGLSLGLGTNAGSLLEQLTEVIEV